MNRRFKRALFHDNLTYLKNSYNFTEGERTLNLAAKYGSYHCLKWLLERVDPTSHTLVCAALNGNVKCFRLIEENFDSRPPVAYHAAMYGNFDCLVYVHESGYPGLDMVDLSQVFNIPCRQYVARNRRGTSHRLNIFPVTKTDRIEQAIIKDDVRLLAHLVESQPKGKWIRWTKRFGAHACKKYLRSL